MQVSNEIKEEIRRTQSDLKNAIRVHQIWVAKLQEDENNALCRRKVKEAENEIIAVSRIQKGVVNRLRCELELYQRRLKLSNKQVNVENDNRHVAQQLRDHQIQHRNKNRTSLLKPSVLTEIHRSENGEAKAASDDVSDCESKLSNGASTPSNKENGTCSEDASARKYSGSTVNNSGANFVNTLNQVNTSYRNDKLDSAIEWWQAGSQPGERSDSDGGPGASGDVCPSPSPSPPPLPHSPHAVSQETFLRFLGLVTPRQKEVLEQKRRERRKRCTTSTNRNEFVYGNFDMPPKRKKYNQFPYLQTCTPPQTRSQRLRRQEPADHEKGYNGNGDTTEWVSSLPAGLSVQRVLDEDKACASCGRNDVPSLLVWCSACGVRLHTACAAGRCTDCRAPLPDPAHRLTSAHVYRDKVIERAHLQERNMELCAELRKLEARADGLKDSLALHNEEKRELLSKQIQTQRHLQKLLDVMSRFKDTAVGSAPNSPSDASSSSKSNDE